MIMQDNEKKPALRFKGFTDPWEQRKLGDISEIKTGPFGSTLHADDYVSDGIPIITTEHFKTGSLPIDKCGLPQVSENDFSRLSAYILNAGDIVFSRVGSVDINALITPFQSTWLFSGRVLRVRPQNKNSSQFLHTLLETEDVKNDIRTRAVGQTMPSINTEILKTTPLRLPESTLEQEQLGKYFLNLDTLITLHQRKHEKLVNIKKSMLDKMFPQNGVSVPEIRFKGFTDPWEQRKLGEIAVFSKGVGYSKNDLCEEGTPIILYGRLYTKYETCIFDVDTFVKEKAGGVYSKGGEVIVPASGETAEDISIASVVVKPGILLGGDLNIVSPTAEYDSAFLALTISSGATHKYLSSLAQGKSVVHLHNADIQSVSAKFPTKREQEKIHLLFGKIDTLITLHQRKLEKLQNIKKSCLEKMFV